MIVEKHTLVVEQGGMDEVVAEVKSLLEAGGFPHAFRIYVPHTGPQGVIVMKTEYESLAEFEEYWKGFFASPEADAWYREHQPLHYKHGPLRGKTEFWELAE